MTKIPPEVYGLPLNERWEWARKASRLSHDRIVELMGRSNRSHLIKIENGDHTPRQDLRDDYADALNLPRDLFADQEASASISPFPAPGDGPPKNGRRDSRGGAGEKAEVPA